MDRYSWNDNDSRVDLDALDTESEISENTESSNDEQSVYSDSSYGQREKYLNNNNSNNNNIQNSLDYKTRLGLNAHSTHKLRSKSNDDVFNSQSQSRSKKQTSEIHKVPTDNSYPQSMLATKISSKSYDPFDGEMISTQSSVKNQKANTIANTNTNSSDHNNFYSDNYFKNEDNLFANYLRDVEEDEDLDHTNCDDDYLLPSSNINDDNYSYDYISNVKKKPGDKLKTMWSMPIQNERQYKDLQIITEVSKLQNLTFFSEGYVKNLEDLKISQLNLLIDMVKLTDDSFDEFYEIWNNFNPNENEEGLEGKEGNSKEESDIKKERKIKEDLEVKKEGAIKEEGNENENNQKLSTESNTIPNLTTKTLDSEQIKPAPIQSPITLNNDTKNVVNKNDKVTWFDINNSEGFKLMEKHKQEILNDLDKINTSIDQIDSFTKSMWTGL